MYRGKKWQSDKIDSDINQKKEKENDHLETTLSGPMDTQTGHVGQVRSGQLPRHPPFLLLESFSLSLSPVLQRGPEMAFGDWR